MNLAGRMLRFHVPELVRRRALRELFRSTAAAFGASPPSPAGLSAEGLLGSYAAFTAEQAATVLRSGAQQQVIRRRLYDLAYAIGTRLRNDLDITSTEDAMAAARAVYGMLRIDFQRVSEGDVCVRRCFFSTFYSAPVCHLMSGLDQGLLAGLTGGGRLEFRQRITEGAPCCLATFSEAPS